MPKQESPWITFDARIELRDWLTRNHDRASGIWAVYPKRRTGPAAINWDALVEECLCFGWIDSTPGTVDELHTRTYISPRKPSSGWSRRNKLTVERLRAAGQLHPAGLAAIERAQENGSWELFDLAEALVIPDELAVVRDGEGEAAIAFQSFPERTRKSLLQWYCSAKRPETRAARAQAIIDAAQRGERPKGF